ncbi:L-carnitine dehydratase/bile acid-inducible protein F [Caldalkalibacillus thermarum TA2.A1]|uniref:CoA transferase n=1 Tax=Caldalkalibacillus thermarum (strain TA2.A1) TaxID=986075 RepID=F5L6J6_CALTT|nr:CaiB/BaiF CoA-transferase family protein [Caldalkalibacillus thermarum]EGL83057.1 L-carnitine dehydratase/bile acid-inducible protein F [Caldalkalibacillus thermarum TA2.A1]QZT33551.1 CoA transferase [Caldalkalibacillus thermarum TA2.A1]
MNFPLHSLRVLDLSRLLPGPYCTMLLADFGAEVIKIEEPGLGDYARLYEPKLGTESAMFFSLNRNKKSLSVNLKDERGRAIFLELVKSADVLVESFRPGVMERLGLGYETLKAINPRLIYCAITGYGQSGPYAHLPGHDINYLSFTGLLDLQGEREGKPVIPAVQIADIGGGALMAAVGILLALQARQKTGRGQFIDVSMMDGVLSWLQTSLPAFLASKTLPWRGQLPLSGGLACYQVYETADQRFLAVGALEHKFWQVFCEEIGRPEYVSRLHAPQEEQEQMKADIAEIIKSRTQAEWLERFQGKEACVTPVKNLEEALKDPQVNHREMIVEVEHPELGLVKQLGIPIKLSETSGAIRTLAPKRGEHTAELLAELGYSSAEIAQLRQDRVIEG